MEIVVCYHHHIPSVYILNMISKLGETVAVSLDLEEVFHRLHHVSIFAAGIVRRKKYLAVRFVL